MDKTRIVGPVSAGLLAISGPAFAQMPPWAAVVKSGCEGDPCCLAKAYAAYLQGQAQIRHGLMQGQQGQVHQQIERQLKLWEEQLKPELQKSELQCQQQMEKEK